MEEELDFLGKLDAAPGPELGAGGAEQGAVATAVSVRSTPRPDLAPAWLTRQPDGFHIDSIASWPRLTSGESRVPS